jgi:hypothetical protein
MDFVAIAAGREESVLAARLCQYGEITPGARSGSRRHFIIDKI